MNVKIVCLKFMECKDGEYMNEVFTRIEKLKPHPTEAITLFYNFDDIDVEFVCKVVNHLGEKYPIYLEAAKAFSELPVGSYDLSKYMESVAFYAVYKANFLFNQFNNNIKSLKPSNILYLKRLKDSACSYYIESLNLLPNTKINLLSMILCNYIKLNVALLNYENNHNVDLSGNLNKIFLSCINSSNTTVNEIVWKTIIHTKMFWQN